MDTEQVIVTGNTYNCRDLIKAKGGKWDAATKSWTIQAAAWNRIAALDCGRYSRGCVARPAARISASSKCSKCGTYCYGDCEA